MYQQDFVMRQIEMAAAFIKRLVFGTELPELPAAADAEARHLLDDLLVLAGQKAFGRAEDRLFERMDTDNPAHLFAGLTFYERLNELSDGELTAGGFSRAEVLEGLEDFAAEFGIETPD